MTNTDALTILSEASAIATLTKKFLWNEGMRTTA
jgi:hypothetical protein